MYAPQANHSHLQAIRLQVALMPRISSRVFRETLEAAPSLSEIHPKLPCMASVNCILRGTDEKANWQNVFRVRAHHHMSWES